jgi:hypothetical protein
MTAPGSYRRKKGLGITIMAGLAFASVGLATPAQADAGQDQDFYRLMTEPDQPHPQVVFNFPLVRSQGIWVCQREDAGETPMHAFYYLDRRHGGPYAFDDANTIVSSAETIYCPSHTDPALPGGGLDMSTPIYPPPIYPPLAWSPPSPHPLPDLPMHYAV